MTPNSGQLREVLSMNKIIVKSHYVTEVNGLLEYVVERFNLTPIVDFFTMILHILLNTFASYELVVTINKLLQKFLRRLELFRTVGIV